MQLSPLLNTTDDGITKVETTFDGDTVWLSLDQMAEPFQRDKSTVSRHIKNVFLRVNYNNRQLLQILQQFKVRVTGNHKSGI